MITSAVWLGVAWRGSARGDRRACRRAPPARWERAASLMPFQTRILVSLGCLFCGCDEGITPSRTAGRGDALYLIYSIYFFSPAGRGRGPRGDDAAMASRRYVRDATRSSEWRRRRGEAPLLGARTCTHEQKQKTHHVFIVCVYRGVYPLCTMITD